MSLVRRKAYFIDAGYTVKNGKTYITLILKGKKTTRLFYQHDPYFLVEAPLEAKNAILAIKVPRRNNTIATPTRVETITKKVGLADKPFLKVFCAEPGDVPLLRTQVPFTCFEHNIPFARRFIFDMQLSPLHIVHYEREGSRLKKILRVEAPAPGEPKLKAMAFDIETYNPQRISLESRDPCLMISYYSSDGKKGVITYKPSKRGFVERVLDEKAMIERFCAIIREIDPDVLVGYNSSNFDLPYLEARARITNARFDPGKFGRGIKALNKGMIKGVRIPGRVHFDIFPAVKFFAHIGLIKTQSMSLDSVSEDVLGKKKLKVDKENIWKTWDSGEIDELCDYSLVDSELTLALSDRFLPLEAELSSVAKMPLFETTLSTSGQLVENLLMYHATEKNELIPSKPGGDSIAERVNNPIQGAFVKLPEPGVYENIAVLDFRGLYPSIIISYNIDPNTLVGSESGVSGLDGCFVSPTGAHFVNSPRGLVPFVLNYLVDMRGKIKDQVKLAKKDTSEYVRLSARSHALKILANSFYGFLGYARARWYSRPCAESVTAWERKHILETIDRAEKMGFQVLYSDTDSVFLVYKTKESVIKFMNGVNDALPEKMELELEDFYTRGVFVSKRTGGVKSASSTVKPAVTSNGAKSADGEDVAESTGAKKKYALLGEDGRIKIRGFELVRRDWSRVARDTQRSVLEAILKDGSKEKAVLIIRDMVSRLKEGKVPLEEVAVSTQITKELDDYDIKSPEVAAAKKLRAANIEVGRGSIVAYVISKNGGKAISERAVPLELAKDYDADYYINNQVLPAVMKIMKELGYDEYSMKMGGKQKGLGDFL